MSGRPGCRVVAALGNSLEVPWDACALDDEIVFEFDANGSDLEIWNRNENLLRSVTERIDRTPD
jgi:hypothetical protein